MFPLVLLLALTALANALGLPTTASSTKDTLHRCAAVPVEGGGSVPGPLLTYKVELDAVMPQGAQGFAFDGKFDGDGVPDASDTAPSPRLLAHFTVQDIGTVSGGVPGCVRELVMASEVAVVVEGGVTLQRTVAMHGLDSLPRLAVLYGLDGSVVEVLEHAEDEERCVLEWPGCGML